MSTVPQQKMTAQEYLEFERAARTKHPFYRDLDSLRDYVLVPQRQTRVEVFSRQDDGNWIMSVVDDPPGRLIFSVH